MLQLQTKIRLLDLLVAFMLFVSIALVLLIPQQTALTCSLYLNLLYLTHFTKVKWTKQSQQLF